MAANEIIAQLGSWDAYEVEGGAEGRRGQVRWCVVYPRAEAGAAPWRGSYAGVTVRLAASVSRLCKVTSKFVSNR